MQISPAIMEISMEVSQKTKNGTTMILLYKSWSYIWRNVSLHSIEIPAQLCLSVQNSQNSNYGITLGIHQLVSGHRKCDNMTYIHNVVLFSHKEEWNYIISWKINETGNYYVKQNKPDWERQYHMFSLTSGN
jgi:hypothetical protein